MELDDRSPRSLENLLLDDNDTTRMQKQNKKTTVILVSISLIVGLAVLSVVTYYALLHLNCFWCHTSDNANKNQTSSPSEITSPTKPAESTSPTKPTESTSSAKPTEITPMTPTETTSPQPSQCVNIADSDKFDCHPDANVNEERCAARKCCYSHRMKSAQSSAQGPEPPGVPVCFFPENYVGYSGLKNKQKTATGYTATLERTLPSGFPNDVKSLELSIVLIDDNTVRITIRDADRERYEVPPNKPIDVKSGKIQQKYDILLTNTTLSILRKASGTAVFQTSLNQMVYSDQFLQLSSLLPTKYIYGLGENYEKLLKNVTWTRRFLFSRDNYPLPNKNLYGTHPFYIGLEKDFNSYGVFLLNSHGIDVILQPKPAITYRAIGGILDFFVFLGPSSDEVVQQYTGILGYPFMPPYWSLGFHLCKYGYGSLNETKKVWERNRNAEIPFDTQWNDIDYMDKRNSFTFDKDNYRGLRDFVEELHDLKMHYVVILDPGVSTSEETGAYPPYDDGIKRDIFIKDQNGSLYIGKVWNYKGTAFPDFTNPEAKDYWENQFQELHAAVPFDGAWIDMNEPANYPEIEDLQYPVCPSNSSLENPPYLPPGQEPLRRHTVCMSATHYNSTPHYSVHNMYGYQQAKLTYFALSTILQKRPFIISRSTFAGQGLWSGHWSGDINSSWEDMRYSIIDLLNFNIFGMPMMGSDICGFRNNSTRELCARWSTLGAFYPFSRNHNDIHNVDQDPAAMRGEVLSAAKTALTIRYQLLPYLYYLFYESHIYGKTVIRPLFFEFTNDPETYDIDEQFLWGQALMIMPVLYEGKNETRVYFPKASWYDYYSGELINASGTYETLKAPIDFINLAFRGGHIIPHQHNNLTTTESRMNKFYLLAGLDDKQSAYGELYWDDGESLGTYEKGAYNLIKFSIQNNTLSSTASNIGYDDDMALDYVKICGFTDVPSEAQLDDMKIDFEKDEHKCVKATVEKSLKKDFTLTWK